MSIDDTSLQDDLFTFLSNKDDHCKKGTIVAAVRGTKERMGLHFAGATPRSIRSAILHIPLTHNLRLTSHGILQVSQDFSYFCTDKIKVF